MKQVSITKSAGGTEDAWIPLKKAVEAASLWRNC
jgi:hypothetical protein